MGRYGFVQDGVDRLYLKDVHARALAALRDKGVLEPSGTFRKAKHEELAAAQAVLDETTEIGAWVDVKRELTAGEARRAFSRLIKEMHFGERPQVDAEQLDFAKIREYVVGWSMKDPEGLPVPFSPDALRNLNVATFSDISAAVDYHEQQQTAVSESIKNETADTTKS